MKSGHPILFLAVLTMTACSSFRSIVRDFPNAEEDPNGRATASVRLGTDDQSRVRRLERTAVKMLDEGGFTPMETLLDQLGRPQCTLRLPRAPGRRLTPSQIYERNKSGVLIVGGVYKCDRCGRWHVGATSGFLITSSGAFVTNYHVAGSERNRMLVAMTHDGRIFPVKEVLAANEEDDVAILQLNAPDTEFEPVALSTDAPVGTPVTVISHPKRRFYSLTQGYVSRYHTERHQGKTSSVMSITADFARGSSGGPVFNEHGAVVGLVRSTVSIYYEVKDGRQENLQMVFKQCVPAASVLKLVTQ